jgi:hypothetical protein
MTFTVSRDDPENRPKILTVNLTYGPVIVHMQEHSSHLRSFWQQLGAELDKVETE